VHLNSETAVFTRSDLGGNPTWTTKNPSRHFCRFQPEHRSPTHETRN